MPIVSTSYHFCFSSSLKSPSKLVKKLLMFSNLGMAKQHQEIKNILKQKYTDEMVFSVINFLNGEFTKSEEIIFKELHKEGQTIVMVTHEKICFDCSSRIIKLSDGEIME